MFFDDNDSSFFDLSPRDLIGIQYAEDHMDEMRQANPNLSDGEIRFAAGAAMGVRKFMEQQRAMKNDALKNGGKK